MSINPEQIAQWLEDFAQRHDLAQKATEGCWKVVHNLLVEGDVDAKLLHAWNVEKLEAHLDKHSFVFTHIWLNYAYVDTQIGLYVKDESGSFLDDLIPIGRFNLRTRLNGEYDDDSFILDQRLSPNDEE
jgi:hypothetical protein